MQNEALEHIEEAAEEEKAKAKEKADKDEAQQEEIDISVSVAAGMSEIDRVQSEVKSQLERVINKANLLPEDLKGTQIDTAK